ncbi:MAG: site-specific integrase [Clostridiales bacterium]|nr:site-specific integrase [Clostridiales bacterium]
MSEKRRDKKRRILRNGETQLPDGRYRYSYYQDGNQKSVYSWKLEETDPLPAGKRNGPALRSKEKEINSAIESGIAYHGGNLTVGELLTKYVEQKKKKLKLSTQAQYDRRLKRLLENPISKKRIDQIKTSDAKLWILSLQEKEHFGYNEIKNSFFIMRQSYQMAVEDDLLIKNPFDFRISLLINGTSTPKDALSSEQEEKFLQFIKNDNCYSKYYDAIFFLFNTGIRISEFCGLTISDIDLNNRCIFIRRQLKIKHGGIFYLDSPKSGAGNRVIPMTDEVYECCQNILKNRKAPSPEPEVDGVLGFLYFTRMGVPTDLFDWDVHFKNICGRYYKKK